MHTLPGTSHEHHTATLGIRSLILKRRKSLLQNLPRVTWPHVVVKPEGAEGRHEGGIVSCRHQERQKEQNRIRPLEKGDKSERKRERTQKDERGLEKSKTWEKKKELNVRPRLNEPKPGR